jgi:hypothetical protein
MKLLNNLKIKMQLLVAFSSVIIIYTLVLAGATMSFNNIANTAQVIHTRHVMPDIALNQLNQSLADTRRLANFCT